MPKTTAQRQADYRRKHLQDVEGGKARLNVILDYPAKLALRRLGRHQGATQAAILERLILEEQQRVLAALTAAEQEAYCDSVTA